MVLMKLIETLAQFDAYPGEDNDICWRRFEFDVAENFINEVRARFRLHRRGSQ